jgi:Spy/CpxP family protein refolding chaperone
VIFMVKSGMLMLIVLVLLAGTSLSAQPRPMRPPVDPLGENLFPPELVMQHQQALELSEDQRNLMKAEIQNAQARFTDLQWQLTTEMETMASLVKQGRIDEQRTLTQLDKIVGLEREMKRTQLALLIRVKNSLTPEQQAKLQTLRPH